MESLVREGIDTIFGYPGGVVLPLYDEMLHWPQVRHVLVRHEQCAAHMADGYARATGDVGVCLATSGPGATNLVTGIATAMMDNVPMVVLTGQVSSWAIGKDAFQETDIKEGYHSHHEAQLPRHGRERASLRPRGGLLSRPHRTKGGPVLVDIPKDVFLATTDAPFPETVERRGYRLLGYPRPRRSSRRRG